MNQFKNRLDTHWAHITYTVPHAYCLAIDAKYNLEVELGECLKFLKAEWGFFQPELQNCDVEGEQFRFTSFLITAFNSAVLSLGIQSWHLNCAKIQLSQAQAL